MYFISKFNSQLKNKWNHFIEKVQMQHRKLVLI